MLARVASYHFESVLYDSRVGAIIRKVSDTAFGQANVFFDEDMIVDPESNFLEQFEALLEKYRLQVLREDTMRALASEITCLLQKTYAEGYLFVGDTINFMRNRPGMIMLYKEPFFEKVS